MPYLYKVCGAASNVSSASSSHPLSRLAGSAMLAVMGDPVVAHVAEDFLVVDKPAGMPTQALAGKDGRSLTEWVIERFPEVRALKGDGRHGGLLHRLDTETSGLVLFARTSAGYSEFRARMRAGEVRKTYLALVLGPLRGQGSVDLPIAHHAKSRRRMLAVRPGMRHFRGKPRPARTEYRVLATRGGHALVEAVITKGARHQIRVHLAALGHPIAGDALYDANAAARPAPRHFLHAARLDFMAPGGGA
ncbi:MAG: RNA pseudouridine synthase, partial [Deltaproteobacteria bacterium]|nr:RNA pseudouridine synthase [Deltaproteobacteria bacterium]